MAKSPKKQEPDQDEAALRRLMGRMMEKPPEPRKAKAAKKTAAPKKKLGG